MTVKSPVVFFTFSRPEIVGRVFETIREAQPRKIYVVSDGPRTNTELALVDTVRQMTVPDWECEFIAIRSSTNLGPRERYISALDQVFSENESAIVLEEDTLPSADFFPFIDSMLSKYADDSTISIVSGFNMLGRLRWDQRPYGVSRLQGTWGFGTWRRFWKELIRKSSFGIAEEHQLKKVSKRHRETAYLSDVFGKTYLGEIDTWDYQLLWTAMSGGMFSIVPPVNLCENIGIGPGATNTSTMPHLAHAKRKSLPENWSDDFPVHYSLNDRFADSLNSHIWFPNQRFSRRYTELAQRILFK